MYKGDRMKKEIILTPEELYYMGTILRAKYIDYAYVAAMGDISQNRGLYESLSREGLAEKGILMEDFSGQMEVDENARKLLEPVFFGEWESSIDVASIAEEGRRTIESRRFHFYEGRITSAVPGEEGILLQAADDGLMQAWIAGLLPEGYQAQEETMPARNMNRKEISRILAVKGTRVGEKSAVEIYVEYQGKIYRELPGDMACAMSGEQFCLRVYRSVKGE